MGDLIECRVEVAAHGSNVDQLQLTATSQGRLLFMSVGSTANRRADGLSGSGRPRPTAVPPEACARFGPSSARPGAESVGHHVVSEFREVPAPDSTAVDPGHVLMWGRIIGQVETTAAKLGFLADMVPVAVSRPPAWRAPAPASTTRCGWVGSSTPSGSSSSWRRTRPTVATAGACPTCGPPTAP